MTSSFHVFYLINQPISYRTPTKGTIWYIFFSVIYYWFWQVLFMFFIWLINWYLIIIQQRVLFNISFFSVIYDWFWQVLFMSFIWLINRYLIIIQQRVLSIFFFPVINDWFWQVFCNRVRIRHICYFISHPIFYNLTDRTI